MSYLTLNHVSKTIKGQPVLNDINLSVEKGEVVAFTGDNGSGKTMLLRAILGFVKSSGEISLAGQPVRFNEQLPVNCGAIIETPNFIPHLTTLENLKYLAAINNTISEAEIIESMKIFALEQKKDSKVKSFSLGMRQKLAIIQAVMEKPDLLLLDEPTNGLDAKAIQRFISLIKEMQKQGTTTLLVSHDPLLLQNLPQKIYHLTDGQLDSSPN